MNLITDEIVKSLYVMRILIKVIIFKMPFLFF